MTRFDFSPIAESLRHSVTDFYRERNQTLTGTAGHNTLESNSGFVERRGSPLLEIFYRRTGLSSVDGLEILDLGCGFGSLSVYFASHGASVTGIDSNRDRLSVGKTVAAEHDLPAEFREGEIQNLDLPSASFDVAVLNNCLCYLIPSDERLTALRESLRVLRPGGVLIMRNPNRWSLRDQFTGLPILQLLPPAQADRVSTLLGKKRSMVRLTSPRAAVKELRMAEFTNIEHVPSPSSRWPPRMKSIARYQHFIAERPLSKGFALFGTPGSGDHRRDGPRNFEINSAEVEPSVEVEPPRGRQKQES
jgi:2-polyprenyl-3-methyl-5-hydroxy-6-metoxy-1,4-benzoquinol methylase